MRYIGFKIATFLLLITGVLSGFLIAGEVDKYPGSLDGSLVEVFENRNGVAWGQVVATLQDVAERNHAGIIRDDDNFYDGDHFRDVYVMSDAPGSDHVAWARDVLAPFGRSPELELTVRPFEPGNVLDPRASYRVVGSEDAARDLMAKFEELGLLGTQASPPALWEVIANHVLNSAGLFAALLAGLVALTVGSVLLSVRRYAVWRVHGTTVPRMIYRDTRALAPFFMATVLFFMATSSGFLLWYNGWNKFSVFARLSTAMVVALGVIVAMAYGLAMLMIPMVSVVGGLKGKVRLGPAMTVLYPVRIGAVLLVVPAIAGVSGSYAGLMNRNDALPYVAKVGDSVNITFPGYRTEKESDLNFDNAGSWLRQLDAHGRAIIVKRGLLQDRLPLALPTGETEILQVNDTFISVQPVLDVAGTRVGPVPENTVLIIIPERLNQYSDAIVDSVMKGFTPGNLPTGVAVPRVQRVVSTDGQAVFAYASRLSHLEGPAKDRPLVHDPVIVAFPNGTPLIRDNSFGARASYNGVVVSRDDVVSSIGKDLAAGSILGMLPLPKLLDDNYAAEVRQLISDVVALLLTVLVLVLVTVTTWLLYARKRVSDMRAGHVAGRGFWRVHRWALLRESIIIVVGVVVWIGVSNWQRVQDAAPFFSQGIPAPPSIPVPDWWRLVPTLTVSVAVIVLFTLLVYATHRRTTAGKDSPFVVKDQV